MNIFQSIVMTFSASVTKILKNISLQNEVQKSVIEKDEKQYGGFIKDDWKKVGKDLKLGIIDYGRTR